MGVQSQLAGNKKGEKEARLAINIGVTLLNEQDHLKDRNNVVLLDGAKSEIMKLNYMLLKELPTAKEEGRLDSTTVALMGKNKIHFMFIG